MNISITPDQSKRAQPHSIDRANIFVAIDGVILRDLPLTHAQYPQLQAAIEQELSRLLATHGLAHRWRQGASLRSLSAGRIQLSSLADIDSLGQHIAAALFRSLGEETL